MNLVELCLSRGWALKHKSGTEWCGPCPSCGGDDRFVVWEQGGRDGLSVTGRWMCRNCTPTGGDYVSLLIDVDGLSPAEALKEAGLYRGGIHKKLLRHYSQTKKSKTVSAVTIFEPWSAQAERVLSSAKQGLRSADAAEFFRDTRGLTSATCRALGFGWQCRDEFFPAQDWGLEGDSTLRVPAGAVLPVTRHGRIVSLLVRRKEPYTPKGSDKQLWFHEVRGGARGYPFMCGPQGAPLVVCESILCAASVYQASGGKVAALATLGASKPILDAEAVGFLKAADVVLVAGDRDDGGEKLYQVVWDVCPNAVAHGVPSEVGGHKVKDVNDLLQLGGDELVSWWLDYGLTPSSPSPAKPEPAPQEAEPVTDEPQEESRPTLEQAQAEALKIWGDEPPMSADAMPDWRSFCGGFPASCTPEGCCYYQPEHPCHCQVWLAAWPDAVRWA